MRKDLCRVIYTISDRIFRAQRANDRLIHQIYGVEVTKMAYASLLLHSKVNGVVPLVKRNRNVDSDIEKDQEGVSLESLHLDDTAVYHPLVRLTLRKLPSIAKLEESLANKVNNCPHAYLTSLGVP